MRNPPLALFLVLSVLLLGMSTGAAPVADVPVDSDNVTSYSAALLRERLAHLAGPGGGPSVVLSVDGNLAASLGAEGFAIQTKAGQVSIQAASSLGLRHGATRFIETAMEASTPRAFGRGQVDIDYPTKAGQAARYLSALPDGTLTEKPWTPHRGVELTNLAMGVGDLIDTPKAASIRSSYARTKGGFRETADVWRDWCDWSARHRMTFLTNWPYSGGTNWWEMAVNPDSAGMSQYSPKEISAAATVREKLFRYARDRGLKPLLLNYVTGAPTEFIRKSHPEILGTRQSPSYPDPFCLSNPELKRIFTSQIRAIVRTYPSLGGFHFRWWFESYPCVCEKCEGRYRELIEDITLDMIAAALDERPDLTIILSGYFRMGGTKEFAGRLPKSVILQSKWGSDWEPTSDPAIPFEKIKELDHPFLISQALPVEETQSVGCVHYASLETGFLRYYDRRNDAPNFSGLAIVAGDKDQEWVTGLNYVAAARLNWTPESSDTAALARNYLLMSFGPAAVEPLFEALDLQQRFWEDYCIDFAGVSPFVDCYRIHNIYRLEKIKQVPTSEIWSKMPRINRHVYNLDRALELVRSVSGSIPEERHEAFRDIELQTEIFHRFMVSRKAMAEAFAAKAQGRFDDMAFQLRIVRDENLKTLELSLAKPNVADYFEMEGMARAVNMDMCKGENKEIEAILKPENIEKWKSEAAEAAKNTKSAK